MRMLADDKWKALLMLDERGPVWETARQAAKALEGAEIPFAVAGGLAVFLHGYRRSTDDVNLLVESQDQSRIREAMTDAGIPWSRTRRAFVGPGSTAVHLLFAGDRIEDTGIANPSPTPAVFTTMDDLPVLRLARIIEIKLAVGSSNIRRSHKDLADVVELIAINRLTKAFAAKLHRSLRAEFKRLVDVARSPG
jgi:hypothetical protein